MDTNGEREPFLVTHQILITAYSAIIAAVINIFYVVFEWRMVLDHASQKTRIARRSTINFPLVVLGDLLCSFSLLQACIRVGAYFLGNILFTTGVVVIAVIGNNELATLYGSALH
ncbi:BZ3500_MvSof-1268-A1-R1_Chr11-1g03239 [Microbotryum saponariae]|uniref:BZ3500_MvSof-1268-A1-R1_Chr11-1g03239 protein n=1 Tax=Microbotryum saponariae TaxID=289078 RepID=A0A2X0LDF6_9BASI|nr:BZ3501_MvSof-1269-A2-R1_Chr11g02814 [Microbotryum saponariae]SDA03799.1 BZ3500_MvSof-1268-A1-R1_Chr11-1g03239 [Microbotryum saponariae]